MSGRHSASEDHADSETATTTAAFGRRTEKCQSRGSDGRGDDDDDDDDDSDDDDNDKHVDDMN